MLASKVLVPKGLILGVLGLELLVSGMLASGMLASGMQVPSNNWEYTRNHLKS